MTVVYQSVYWLILTCANEKTHIQSICLQLFQILPFPRSLEYIQQKGKWKLLLDQTADPFKEH